MKAFTKQGLKLEFGVKISEVKTGKKGVSVAYANAKGEAVTQDTSTLENPAILEQLAKSN